jgi:hypothetical protein
LAVFDVSQYPAAVAELLLPERAMPLDAGKPQAGVRGKIAALKPADVVGRLPVDAAMAAACLSGLWLYHDFLDESHTLSQDIHTPTGSFWHAIMHRREGDYGNSKYWWHRVGAHPAFAAVHEAARDEFRLSPSGPSDPTFDMPPGELLSVLNGPRWDPDRFVDLCERGCNGRADLAKACIRVQQAEWRVLFDFCFRAARGET